MNELIIQRRQLQVAQEKKALRPKTVMLAYMVNADPDGHNRVYSGNPTTKLDPLVLDIFDALYDVVKIDDEPEKRKSRLYYGLAPERTDLRRRTSRQQREKREQIQRELAAAAAGVETEAGAEEEPAVGVTAADGKGKKGKKGKKKAVAVAVAAPSQGGPVQCGKNRGDEKGRGGGENEEEGGEEEKEGRGGVGGAQGKKRPWEGDKDGAGLTFDSMLLGDLIFWFYPLGSMSTLY